MLRMDITINLDLQKHLNYRKACMKKLINSEKKARQDHAKKSEARTVKFLKEKIKNPYLVVEHNNIEIDWDVDIAIRDTRTNEIVEKYDVKEVKSNSDICNIHHKDFRISAAMYTTKDDGKLSLSYTFNYLIDPIFSGLIMDYNLYGEFIRVDKEAIIKAKELHDKELFGIEKSLYPNDLWIEYKEYDKCNKQNLFMCFSPTSKYVKFLKAEINKLKTTVKNNCYQINEL